MIRMAMTTLAIGGGLLSVSTNVQAADVTAAEARAIAKEAYIYGFPMVDNYRIQYAYFVDTKNPEYKAPWNQIVNIPRVYTPDDKAIQTPNSDTPYSMLGLDLRAEPIVLTVPPIEKDRYFSIQLIDAYTFNFAYIGSRATGNDGGSFLVAGPGWKGETPKGVKKVIRSETELVLAAYRTQLFNPDDLDNVKKIQAGYKAQPLSAFLGQPAPKAAPAIDFIKPLIAGRREDVARVLQHPELRPAVLPDRSVREGTDGALRQDRRRRGEDLRREHALARDEDGHRTRHGRRLGRSCELAERDRRGKGDLRRPVRHAGVSEEQLPLPHGRAPCSASTAIRSRKRCIRSMPSMPTGQKLDGANRYTVRFAPGELPPVNAFWSLTMYELPAEPARRQSDQPLPAQLADAAAVREGRRRRPDASMSRTNRRARTRSRTGCLRRKVRSSWRCASTGRSKKRSTARGSSRR